MRNTRRGFEQKSPIRRTRGADGWSKSFVRAIQWSECCCYSCCTDCNKLRTAIDTYLRQPAGGFAWRVASIRCSIRMIADGGDRSTRGSSRGDMISAPLRDDQSGSSAMRWSKCLDDCIQSTENCEQTSDAVAFGPTALPWRTGSHVANTSQRRVHSKQHGFVKLTGRYLRLGSQ